MMDTPTVALVVAVLVNFGGVIWGAASVVAAVKELRRIVGKLTEIIEVTEVQVAKHERRLTLIEWRLDNMNRAPSGIDARRAQEK